MNFFIRTLGCKVNQSEMEGLEYLLHKKGWNVVNDINKADYAIVNTCTVTNVAAAKSRQLIHKIKSKNPDIKIILTGCYAEEHKVELDENIKDDVHIVVGNNLKSQIPEIITNNTKKRWFIDEQQKFDYIPLGNMHGNKTRMFIKIQDGCDAFCSYCIIPYMRGRSRSLSPELVLNEIKSLINSGVKEIVLSGIHVGMYGRDLDEKITFSELVAKIMEINGDFRLRLSSMEPMEVDDLLLDIMRNNDKLCPFLHLSLQAGDNWILKKMNRNYTIEKYAEVVAYVREKIPDVALSTDIIVGFPGENDEIFERELLFYEKMRFFNTHIFTFSAKKGTVAYNLPDKIPKKIIKKRISKLKKISLKNRYNYIDFIAQEKSIVLTEKLNNNFWVGKNEYYIPVWIENNAMLSENQFIEVMIKRDKDFIFGVQI